MRFATYVWNKLFNSKEDNPVKEIKKDYPLYAIDKLIRTCNQSVIDALLPLADIGKYLGFPEGVPNDEADIVLKLNDTEYLYLYSIVCEEDILFCTFEYTDKGDVEIYPYKSVNQFMRLSDCFYTRGLLNVIISTLQRVASDRIYNCPYVIVGVCDNAYILGAEATFENYVLPKWIVEDKTQLKDFLGLKSSADMVVTNVYAEVKDYVRDAVIKNKDPKTLFRLPY